MEERVTRLDRLLVMAVGTAAALAGCYAKGSGVRDGEQTILLTCTLIGFYWL
uniref:Uncharacterized protein n=1 Tax=Oryza sativa subsp. japonica TaxID=39947 RepID=Q84NV2_ORYSJ|nr:hypothetical protein [Oryza sativa Japonica Group]